MRLSDRRVGWTMRDTTITDMPVSKRIPSTPPRTIVEITDQFLITAQSLTVTYVNQSMVLGGTNTYRNEGSAGRDQQKSQ